MISQGWDVVTIHGNGPQVGYIMRRSELALSEVATVPLDYVVADTQSGTGYMFITALNNELDSRKMKRPVVAVLTRTVVDPGDPAFTRPTKPVGSYVEENVARQLERELWWTTACGGPRGGGEPCHRPLPKRLWNCR